MQTAYDVVFLAAQRAPDHLAIVDDRSDRKLTHKQFIAEIDRIAAGLLAAGIRPGQYVATVLPNLFEHALALMALQRLGAIPALINPRLKPEEAGELVSHGRMHAAIVQTNPAAIAAIKPRLPAGAPLIGVGGAADGVIDFAALNGEVADLPSVPRPKPDDTAFIFYTSGTTGLPKGVMLPHRATDARMLYMSMQCGVVHGRHNRFIGLMPLFHVVGFYSVFLTAIGFDGTYYVCSLFEPGAAVDAIERDGITLVYGSPTHFHGLISAPNFSAQRIASVKSLIYAGAAMPGPLLERMGATFPGRKIVNIYGTTEVMNALYFPDPVGKPHTYRPGFYANVRVGKFGGSVDDIAPIGQDGELLVDITADATFTGYLNRPDATAQKVQNGWYRTGDIAVRRADGDIDVKGRVDDMILSGAENIYPDEVEATLIQHKSVREVSVIGVADQKWGEIVVACIVADGTEPSEAELDAHCRTSRLADYKRPRAYVFMDALPKNAANKVLRRVLRDQATQALPAKAAG